eukprot:746334-Rhodomonas_salina.2
MATMRDRGLSEGVCVAAQGREGCRGQRRSKEARPHRYAAHSCAGGEGGCNADERVGVAGTVPGARDAGAPRNGTRRTGVASLPLALPPPRSP